MHRRTAAEVPLPVEHAFVVQFRANTDRPGYARGGRVEHVVSGKAARFSSPTDLLAFMAGVLAALTAAPALPPGASDQGGSR